jgi:primosomal protein N' (replication factor Y)
LIARVLPDVAALDKEFDYWVPEATAGSIEVGTEVRVDLSGRRVGGWVTAVGVEPTIGMALRPIAKVRGFGPDGSLVDLAGWAAWRWAGRRRSLLATASAGFAVPRLPPPALKMPARPAPSDLVDLIGALDADAPTLLRLPPAADPTGVVAEMAQRGPTLVVVPTVARAAVLAGRLRRAGGDVAMVPEAWPQARSGAAIVIGSRASAWAPCPGLAAVVVLDGHDEGLSQEQAPTWGAVAVVAERARRAGVPCVVITSCPTPELLALGPVRVVGRSAERSGWAAVEVIDRRGDDPRLGLYSERLVALIRAEARVVCVLNRTGRSRLLACTACGSVASCERCGASLSQQKHGDAPISLDCARCGLVRPQVCAECDSTRLRTLRIGVTRAREDLEILAGRPAAEVTGAKATIPDADLLVGTEAVLHRLGPADTVTAVAFVDFDQELLAGRVRAPAEALSLIALASRIVRGRAGRVMVQTRIPGHPVLRAAVLADPAVLSGHEVEVRRELRLPPFSSIALVSGPASTDYANGLRGLPGTPVDVLGPDGDQWLVRGSDDAALADALASVPRPAGRLRVAVDPGRL